jgi:hypothetical protein
VARLPPRRTPAARAEPRVQGMGQLVGAGSLSLI